MAGAVSLVNKGTNFFVALFGIYMVYVGNTFRTILWPKFPDIDPQTHSFITKHGNVVRPGDTLRAKLWVGTVARPPKKAPLFDFEFKYDWEGFQAVSHKVNASITQTQLRNGKNMLLSAEVVHAESGRKVFAEGGLVKQMKRPEVQPKYRLLTGESCPEPEEPFFAKRTHIGRGIPMMQVRLVFDTTAYPYWMVSRPYMPMLFVDEFWMTNDQLVKLNATGTNAFESEVHFGLMSSARWNFQRHMESALKSQAGLFAEDSEEALQTRDLFANTNSYLLAVTLVVSMLHMVFEILAFKNDVEFWQGCDPATLNKYMSVQSILVGIFMQILLLMYLWDESANMLVLLTGVVAIVVDAWKVQKAMTFGWVRLLGRIPVPALVSKVQKEKKDDFDTIAMKWLAVLLSPGIVGYGVYSLVYTCHRGWYAYFLNFSASCVYSLGFVLMTPQVFINYKYKTVAYLPWRKFIYRAICTFIDDLFALIIRMPTMHRLSCFRDDIVFFIYLYQRHLYPVDKSRSFDEDGYELSSGEAAAAQASGDAAAPPLAAKKDQ